MEYYFIKTIQLLKKKKRQRSLRDLHYAIAMHSLKMAAFIAALYFIAWSLHWCGMDCSIKLKKGGSKQKPELPDLELCLWFTHFRFILTLRINNNKQAIIVRKSLGLGNIRELLMKFLGPLDSESWRLFRTRFFF